MCSRLEYFRGNQRFLERIELWITDTSDELGANSATGRQTSSFMVAYVHRNRVAY